MKKKSSPKRIVTILIITILIAALLLLMLNKNDNNLKEYGSLYINYNEFKEYKEDFNLDIGNYNYDIQNRFENPEDMQLTLNNISKINYIYQDILFMYSILTKEKTSYILDEDRNSFLNMIDLETLDQWNQMLIEEEKTINKELLEEEEIQLLENITTLRELIKQSIEKSFKEEYDTERLKVISKNIEKNMGYLITINLISEGNNKEKIDEVFNGLENNKETFFKDSFYYKYMLN